MVDGTGLRGWGRLGDAAAPGYEHNGERYDTLTMAGCADCTVTGNSVISFNRERPVIRLGAGRDTGEKCRHNDVTLNKVLPSTGYEEELDQAAEIDGCSTLRIFGQIIVPLMMPAVATVAVLGFMDFWNDFFAPFIYLNNVDKDTIVLRLFRIWSDVEGYMREELHTVMAGNVMVTLPGFIIFFIAQKRFIQGIVTTGIKG